MVVSECSGISLYTKLLSFDCACPPNSLLDLPTAYLMHSHLLALNAYLSIPGT